MGGLTLHQVPEVYFWQDCCLHGMTFVSPLWELFNLIQPGGQGSSVWTTGGCGSCFLSQSCSTYLWLSSYANQCKLVWFSSQALCVICLLGFSLWQGQWLDGLSAAEPCAYLETESAFMSQYCFSNRVKLILVKLTKIWQNNSQKNIFKKKIDKYLVSCT